MSLKPINVIYQNLALVANESKNKNN
jgi:hypothetical protein